MDFAETETYICRTSFVAYKLVLYHAATIFGSSLTSLPELPYANASVSNSEETEKFIEIHYCFDWNFVPNVFSSTPPVQ